MPAVQSTFSSNQAAAFLGQIADGEQVTNVISRVVDPATANPISFGDPVLQGASDGTIQSVSGGSGAFRGIAVRDPTLPPSAGDQYVATLTAAVLTKGVIWVNATVAVAAGQPAYVTSAGALTNVATNNTAIANGMWDSTTTIAGLARLRLG
ncbi:structural cement protein Gp24 [Lichenifustis flavocetrariae]|uniref:DUF2190 domain-containing protein n=1 Tax=Lichenifustis flavocetrariae TaxID=2949735 RepID=A0AA41Z608_9HYPH|nr:DUF2190 domain-containing protein [Lichenifustis flavocetrariae]MCW6510975.1 DUF2190 domain-containing protein [Lichenifustis flavocetrariae]